MRGRRLDRAAPTVREFPAGRMPSNVSVWELFPLGALPRGPPAPALTPFRGRPTPWSFRRHDPGARRDASLALAAPAPAGGRGRRRRSSASCPSSCTTAATTRRSPRSRRSPAGARRARRASRSRRSTAAAPGAGCSTGCSSPRNDQDRGVVRTGRHAGDWELVQYAVRDGALVRGVYSQHSRRRALPGGRDPDDAARAPARLPRQRLARGLLPCPACATGCGPTRTTRPTGRGRACGRGWSASRPTSRRG